jgi:hypothetical protein
MKSKYIHLQMIQIMIIIIQLNSIRVYYRANLKAQRPITKLARRNGNTQSS